MEPLLYLELFILLVVNGMLYFDAHPPKSQKSNTSTGGTMPKNYFDPLDGSVLGPDTAEVTVEQNNTLVTFMVNRRNKQQFDREGPRAFPQLFKRRNAATGKRIQVTRVVGVESYDDGFDFLDFLFFVELLDELHYIDEGAYEGFDYNSSNADWAEESSGNSTNDGETFNLDEDPVQTALDSEPVSVAPTYEESTSGGYDSGGDFGGGDGGGDD